MNKNNETVSEVCDLIRTLRLDLSKTYGELADRILSAHEREMAAKDARIARLEAAMKPVMECTIECIHVPEIGMCKVDLYEAQRASFKAVQNAQGIMRYAEI